jgi:hypothetical protein
MKKLVIITGLLLMVVLLGTVSCGQAKVSEEDYGNGSVKTTSSGQAVYPTP